MMVDDDLLEPAKGYPHLRERVLKEAEKIFDGLVKDANVNLPNNDSTCDKYYEKEKEIEEVGKTLGKKKALKGFCIFLTIAFFVAAIVGIFGIANSWNMGLCIGLLAGGIVLGIIMNQKRGHHPDESAQREIRLELGPESYLYRRAIAPIRRQL